MGWRRSESETPPVTGGGPSTGDAHGTSRADAILGEIRGERGYTLSYHELLARTDPDLLVAYRDMYRRFTIESRRLDTRRRELIWTALLTAIREYVGSVHIERATSAGVPIEDLRAAVRLAGASLSWGAVEYAHGNWTDLLGGASGPDEYRRVVAGCRSPISEVDADLILLVLAGARMAREQFLHHLERSVAAGLPEPEIVEAISYLLVPLGANIFLWATDTWLEAVRAGEVPAGEITALASADIRTA